MEHDRGQVAPFNAGDFVKVKGKVQLYQGALQMILTHIQPIPPEGIDPADFHATTSGNVDADAGPPQADSAGDRGAAICGC